MEQGILFRGYSLPNISVTVWPHGWIIPCPIQKHLYGRVVGLFSVQYRIICVVGLFIVQYRSSCVTDWLDYIHCPIQKHLGSQVVGAPDFGLGNEKIQQTKN